jgi:hypothetical protein
MVSRRLRPRTRRLRKLGTGPFGAGRTRAVARVVRSHLLIFCPFRVAALFLLGVLSPHTGQRRDETKVTVRSGRDHPSRADRPSTRRPLITRPWLSPPTCPVEPTLGTAPTRTSRPTDTLIWLRIADTLPRS